MVSIRLERTGQRLISILSTAWQSPFTTKANIAREYADEIAAAASLGYLTTQQDQTHFGRTWLITSLGLNKLLGKS